MPEIRHAQQADIQNIASMHLTPEDCGIRKIFRKHFYYDKCLAFYSFEKKSTLVSVEENGDISGVLIYTYNEKLFQDFMGPKHFRFYFKAFKTLTFYYGFTFLKFFRVFLSLFKKHPIHQRNENEFGKIWVLIVREQYRGQQIATKLLKASLREQQKTKLKLQVTVKKDNEPALKLYTKNHFKIIGECMESSGDSHIMEHQENIS